MTKDPYTDEQGKTRQGNRTHGEDWPTLPAIYFQFKDKVDELSKEIGDLRADIRRYNSLYNKLTQVREDLSDHQKAGCTEKGDISWLVEQEKKRGAVMESKKLFGIAIREWVLFGIAVLSILMVIADRLG